MHANYTGQGVDQLAQVGLASFLVSEHTSHGAHEPPFSDSCDEAFLAFQSTTQCRVTADLTVKIPTCSSCCILSGLSLFAMALPGAVHSISLQNRMFPLVVYPWPASFTKLSMWPAGAQVIDKIRRNPEDRRIVLTAWNPAALPEMALPPCHMFCQACMLKFCTTSMTLIQANAAWPNMMTYCVDSCACFMIMLNALCCVVNMTSMRLSRVVRCYSSHEQSNTAIAELEFGSEVWLQLCCSSTWPKASCHVRCISAAVTLA